MNTEVEEANKYLVHNVRSALLHLKLLQRKIARISLDIEKTLNIYRETIDDLVDAMKIDYPMVDLIRLNEDDKLGTFGALRIQGIPFCVTLEPQDRLNEPFKSSIPAQQYWCKRFLSPKYGETFQVTLVPGRDLILFHPGNRVADTLGCIILAQYWGKLYGDRAVLNSGNTFKEFMHVMKPFDEFNLTVREVY